MPSAYLPTLPSDVLLDSGVLSFVPPGGGARTYWVSTRTGVAWRTADETRNAAANMGGLRTDRVAGLTRVVRSEVAVSGEFLELSAARAAMLDHGGTTAASGGGTAVVPGAAASALFADARYLQDVWLEFQRGDGGSVRVVFERAVRVDSAVAGTDGAEATVALSLSAALNWTGT